MSSDVQKVLHLDFIVDALGHIAVGNLRNLLAETSDPEKLCNESNLSKFYKQVAQFSDAFELEPVHVLDRRLKRVVAKMSPEFVVYHVALRKVSTEE